MFSLIPNTNERKGHTVTSVAIDAPKVSTDLPCKNVDLQTGQYWAMTANDWGDPFGGYQQVGLLRDVKTTEALRDNITEIDSSGMVSGSKPGWFFVIPKPELQNPADGSPPPVGRREMMQSSTSPYGAIINLNPSCFGEVYWIGGEVQGDYMAFAVLGLGEFFTREMELKRKYGNVVSQDG